MQVRVGVAKSGSHQWMTACMISEGWCNMHVLVFINTNII